MHLFAHARARVCGRVCVCGGGGGGGSVGLCVGLCLCLYVSLCVYLFVCAFLVSFFHRYPVLNVSQRSIINELQFNKIIRGSRINPVIISKNVYMYVCYINNIYI